MTDDILEYARQLATKSDARSGLNKLGQQPLINSMTDYQRYHLEIPEDTHWELVKLAADLRMHPEDYAQNVLIGHVENELDRKTRNQCD